MERICFSNTVEDQLIDVIAKLSNESEAAFQFFGWQSRFSAVAAAAPGFISLEFVPLGHLEERVLVEG
jgi:antibiotic biosynthesis monooxygenase (ABM) superfamily enzyme